MFILNKLLEISLSTQLYKLYTIKIDAQEGGKIAGDAKKALELKTSKKVSTIENFLKTQE